MERLTANLSQFSSAIAKNVFFNGDWTLNYVCTQFRDFTKLFSFSKPFDNS